MEGLVVFMIVTGLFAAMWARHNAQVDDMRRQSQERIAGWQADFQRRLDEFNAAHPTASCANCEYGDRGSCRLTIRAPRHFCTQWSANDEHGEALRTVAMTDAEIIAQLREAPVSASMIKEIEEYRTTVDDKELRLQLGRVLRLAQHELMRIALEGNAHA